MKCQCYKRCKREFSILEDKEKPGMIIIKFKGLLVNPKRIIDKKKLLELLK